MWDMIQRKRSKLHFGSFMLGYIVGAIVALVVLNSIQSLDKEIHEWKAVPCEDAFNVPGQGMYHGEDVCHKLIVQTNTTGDEK